MKTEGEIRQKLKQVLFRYRKKRLETLLSPYPDNCMHNSEMEPRDRHDEAPNVQVCFYTTLGVPRGVVCDVRYDNGQRAKDCPLFEPRVDKEQINAEFQELLESGSMGEIAQNFPDAAALMWVLDDSEAPSDEAFPEEEAPDDRWNWGRWPWSKRRP